MRRPPGLGWSMIGRAVDDARATVDTALLATRRLDALELQALLERAAVTLGVPVFMDEVVAPLLDRLGHGWGERSVSVAQEHMASAVVRRVLGWLLRVYEVKTDAPRLVVATPPDHAHEIGALMAAVSAAAEGWSVTYLGPDLPVADLVSAARETRGTRGRHQRRASSLRPGTCCQPSETPAPSSPRASPLLIGGAAGSRSARRPRPRARRVIESLEEFRALLPHLAKEANA